MCVAFGQSVCWMVPLIQRSSKLRYSTLATFYAINGGLRCMLIQELLFFITSPWWRRSHGLHVSWLHPPCIPPLGLDPEPPHSPSSRAVNNFKIHFPPSLRWSACPPSSIWGIDTNAWMKCRGGGGRGATLGGGCASRTHLCFLFSSLHSACTCRLRPTLFSR